MWQRLVSQLILSNQTSLPAVCITLFNKDGNYTGKKYFHGFTPQTEITLLGLTQPSHSQTDLHKLYYKLSLSHFRPVRHSTSYRSPHTCISFSVSHNTSFATSTDHPISSQGNISSPLDQLQVSPLSINHPTSNQANISSQSDQTQASTLPINKTPTQANSTLKREFQTPSNVLQTIPAWQLAQEYNSEDCLTINVGIPDTPCSPLRTKAERLIKRAVGCFDDLQPFDELRYGLREKVKDRQRLYNDEKEQYEKLLAQIHTKLLLHKCKLKDELKATENCQF